MARHAVAVRFFAHADQNFAKDELIRDLSDGHFADWEAVGLVRAATDEEVAAATTPAPARKGKPA